MTAPASVLSTAVSVARVPFHGSEILVVAGATPAETLVVMKPMVEGFGLDWESQRKKIERHPVLTQGASIMTVPSAGGAQETVCMKLPLLGFWLATLSPMKIADLTIRERVIAYQSEAADLLYRRFFTAAGRSDGVPELDNPKAARRRLIQALQQQEDLEGQIEALSIKAEALDRISATEGAITITQAADNVGIPFEVARTELLQKGWIKSVPNSDQWSAAALGISGGFTENRGFTVESKSGKHRPYRKVNPVLTPAGQKRFYELVAEKGIPTRFHAREAAKAERVVERKARKSLAGSAMKPGA